MNAEMMQKLIEFGAEQERARAEFVAKLVMQSIPCVGTGRFGIDDLQAPMPATRPIKRGRRAGSNSLATQIRSLLSENGNSGTVADIAAALAVTDKKVVGALNSMKARGIVTKSGRDWHMIGGNGGLATV